MSYSANSFDFCAEYHLTSKEDLSLATDTKDRFSKIDDLHARLELLSQSRAFGLTNEARDQYQRVILSGQYNNYAVSKIELMKHIGLIPEINQYQINNLPFGSFFLQFSFNLDKSWYSKDDTPFYIIDNPVRKDKVFKVPMMSASSWKGLLLWACRMDKGCEDCQTIRIFGTEKGEQDENRFRSGRLMTYSTFFNKVGLELINPHNRETKAGTIPINFEVVPASADGIFTILYVPFDLIGESENLIIEEVFKDIILLAASIKKLLLEYGFSAKRSVGWGTATVSDIKILTNIKENIETKEPQTPNSPSELKLPDLTGLKNIKALWNENGELKILSNKELLPLEIKKKNPNGILSKTQINLYKEAREILQKNLSELTEYEKALEDYRRKHQEYETDQKKEEYIGLSSARDFDEVMSWIKEKGAVNG